MGHRHLPPNIGKVKIQLRKIKSYNICSRNLSHNVISPESKLTYCCKVEWGCTSLDAFDEDSGRGDSEMKSGWERKQLFDFRHCWLAFVRQLNNLTVPNGKEEYLR